jgi:WD40 repeat protein
MLPMIADRTTFNNLMSASKEIYDCSQTLIANGKITPPWPHTSFPVTSSLWSTAFSPSNGLLACGTGNGTIHIWNGGNGSSTQLEGHTAGIQDLAISPSGSLLATASSDHMVRLWTLADSSCRILEGHTGEVNAIGFSPEGLSLASGSDDRSIRFWNVSDGRSTLILHDERLHEVFYVSYSPDGKTLASAGGNGDEGSGAIIIWSVSDDGDWSPFLFINEQEGVVWSVAYSPDGRYLASGGDLDAMRLWNACDGSLKYVFQGHTRSVLSVCFSPNGKILASGSQDKSVRLWNVEDGSNLLVLHEHHEGAVMSMAFSADGRTLASAGNPAVQLWNPWCEVKKTNRDEICRLWIE